MSAQVKTRLAPRERLTRGLTYTVVGPVDVTRGLLGLGMHSAQAGASNLRQRYREGRLASDLSTAQETVAQELAAAHEVVTGLPTALKEARRSQRHGKRPWLIAGAAAKVQIGRAHV